MAGQGREHPLAARLRALAGNLPGSALVTLPVSELRAWLDADAPPPTDAKASGAAADWRERLWTCPEDVLLGVHEIAEALGRPVSWVYRRTGEKAQEPRLPVMKLSGEVVVRAEDLRRWVRVNLESADPRRFHIVRGG